MGPILQRKGDFSFYVLELLERKHRSIGLVGVIKH